MEDKAHTVAQCAQLAMLLEVSTTPKPGNVDRSHNFEDTSFEHFLASAVGALPALIKASSSGFGIGGLIRDVVAESMRWHRGGNTHFGTFLLLVPLCMAAGMHTEQLFTPSLTPYLKSTVSQLVRATTVNDSLEFLEAFHMANVRVKDVNELDIKQHNTAQEIERRQITLFELMEMSARYDLVAREWVCGFEESFEGARMIRELEKRHTINDAIMLVFINELAQMPDSFVATKFGGEVADDVCNRARSLQSHIRAVGIHEAMDRVNEFDDELISAHINPGSTADIVGAALFIALLEGLVI
ncbi:MAG: triphosphoribosyl-dephospho-CoA synthase [Methermicoccaceae archaeon]